MPRKATVFQKNKKLIEDESISFEKGGTIEDDTIDSPADEIDLYSCGPTGDRSAICPDCGQLVPSMYDAFISQEAADDYARAHCDCNREQSGADVLLGYCKFCGQAAQVPEIIERDCTASEHATLNCRCGKAKNYQNELIAKERREQILREVNNSIDELFKPFNDAQNSDGNENPSTTVTIELLKLTATLVYDRFIKDVIVNVTHSTKAKISRTSKGNLVIERKDSASKRTEVSA